MLVTVTRREPLPDIRIGYESDQYVVSVSVPVADGDRTHTVKHTSLSTALETAGSITSYITRHGGVHTNPGERGERAAAMIADAKDVVDAVYRGHDQRVVIRRKSLDTDIDESLRFCAGLEQARMTVKFSRDFGLHARYEYDVAEYAPDLPDEAWEDAHNRLFDREPFDDLHLDFLRKLANEYDGKSEIVHDEDGEPRLAGTTANPLHIYYLSEEQGRTVEELKRFHPELTEEDVATITEYAENNPEKAEKHVQERNKELQQFNTESNL